MVSELKVRRVRFDLTGDDIPFNWHPGRPQFGMICNLISFFAPGFETFIVDATREALPLMRDPSAVEESNLYLRQEAQHSSAHVRHINALCRRWPGLQEVSDKIMASYNELTATKSLEWRLAYTAVIENTFTPYFKVFLDHDDKLFQPGDERVSSLFVWHFVEEMEHRSSALIAYNAIHDNYIYRSRRIPDVIKHVGEICAIAHQGFRKHVPAEDGGELGRLIPNGLSPRALRDVIVAGKELATPQQQTYAGVPKSDLFAMLTGLIKSQAPRHDPVHQPLPPLADEWRGRFEEEPRSAAHWYTVGVNRATASAG